MCAIFSYSDFSCLDSSTYEQVEGERENFKLYALDGYLYVRNQNRANKDFFNCQEGRTDTIDKSQLWKNEHNNLKNNGDAFKSQDKWRLKGAGRRNVIKIINETNNKVLTANDDGTVIEDHLKDNNARQLWKRGKANIEGYFTIQNAEKSTYLTATSNGSLEIKESIEHPKCGGKATLYRDTNKMVMTHDHQKHHCHFIHTLIVYVVCAQFPR